VALFSRPLSSRYSAGSEGKSRDIVYGKLVKPPLSAKSIAAIAVLLISGTARAWAQGGPPMLTDDTGTPGNGTWEINVGCTAQQMPGSSEFGAPQLDLNYGIGNRIELTYFATYLNDREDGESSKWGASASEMAVKWRFYDGGDHGLQVSVYPEVVFLTPGSHSDRRGLTDGNTNYVLPLEFQRDYDLFSLDIDCGHDFCTGTDKDSWFGGVCIGKEMKKGWELDAELHWNADENIGRAECIGNLATRIDLSEKTTLMFLLGRDLSNRLGPKASLMSYIGIQLRL
jgi:hypothetical protein